MTRHCKLALLFLSLILIAVAARAGEIESHLADRVQAAAGDTQIKVWIKMVDAEDAYTFKRSIDRASASRAVRHSIALSDLKRKAQAQENMLAELGQLATAGRASNVKGHWIANVVEAEVSADQLAALAARSDVEAIYEAPVISLIQPDHYGPAPDALSPEATEANLTHINAPAAWGLGYTGAGRLICSFDTGVDGTHPALASRWKGTDGDSAAAWFDPVYNWSRPHAIGSGTPYWHGTHTMGIMVGFNEGLNQHYGVAYDAKWISAAVIDIPGASILDAFEWAADPDGDPNTLDDVPDVINHSWGYPNIQCANVFYDAIDNTEALGIVNIFAAGNDGTPGPSILNPADRALTDIDCFAVGNLTYTSNTITASSSRGPSPCDPSAYKPNVVAPGASIVSCYPGGTTYTAGGTSQAAPHVSGLVALLRQKNPDATVDEIKTAILNSTQNHSWGTLPNNTYGWGEIDCEAALNALSAPGLSPSLRVYDCAYAQISPGDLVNATVLLQNLGGASASGVSGTLSTSNAAVTVLDGSVSFSTIADGDTVRSSDYLQVQISDTVTPGTLLPVNFTINGTSPLYQAVGKLYFLVETPAQKGIVSHTGNRIEFSLSNFGVFGFAEDAIFPLSEPGFTVDGGANQMYEGGIIAGVGYGQVASGVHSLLFDPDMDFAPAPGGSLELSIPGSRAAQQTYCRFDDSRAANPMGLLVTQESFYYDSPNDDFLTLKYTLKNTSASTLSDLYFGLFLDFDINTYSSNAGGYDSEGDLTWMAYHSGASFLNYRGVCLLQGTLGAAGAIGPETYNHYPPIAASGAGDGFDSTEKYSMITSALLYSESNKTVYKDLFMVTSAGPLSLAPQASDTVAFALLVGANLTELRAAAESARTALTDVDDPGSGPLPQSFALFPNYPNPFNPTTTLAFELPRKQSYKLEVFNTLGQTVFTKEAVDGPGMVAVEWSGEGLASGAYFYRVTSGEQSQARKMMLIK